MDGQEILGTISIATVCEEQKTVYIGIMTEDGKGAILRKPMSDNELMDYKKHPEAFFGKIQHPSKKINTPYELFEFFVDSYQNTSKEQLLEFMKEAADLHDLRKMKGLDLLLEYCERMTWSVKNNNVSEKKQSG